MPEINDLRSFIDVLEENGQLATISQEVSINHEIADITASPVSYTHLTLPTKVTV